MTSNSNFAQRGLFSLLLIFLSVVCFCLLSFVFKISMSPFTIVIPLALLLLVSFLKDKKLFFGVVLNLAILFVFIYINTFFFDWSYDGMYYHKQAVITLKEGWNPLYEAAIDKDIFASYPDMSLWLENYPKGLWIFQAAIYSLTNLLESAKAVNILFINAVFFAAFDTMERVYNFSRKKSLLFAFIFSINPVFISQLFTFYNDLAVGSLFIIALLLCQQLYKNCATFFTFCSLFCISAISLTIKFTAPCLLALIFITFGILCAIKQRKNIIWLKKPCLTIIAGFLAGLIFLGFDPYIEHIKNSQHIIHPVMGDEKYDIMNTNPPKGFLENLSVENLFISIFSKSSNDIENKPTLKIPFSFSSEELEPLSNADTRIGGFGVFFSGILSFSLALAIFYIIKRKKFKKELLFSLFLLILLMLFFPESWWARYASFIYYIPCFFLIFSADSKKRKAYILLSAVIILNSFVTCFSVISSSLSKTMDLNSRLEEIKKEDKKILLRVNDFPTHVKLFSEYGIDFEISHEPISPGESIFYRNTKYKFIE